MKRLVLLAFLVWSSFAIAQSAPAPSAAAGPTKDPVAVGLRFLVQRAQGNIIGAIQAMPADKFSYKPTPDQVTFAHLLVHTIGSNYLLCTKASDQPAPKVEELKETASKEEFLAAAKASFSYCSDVLAKMDDSKLGDTLDIFGNGHQFPRSVAALALASGWADHYGTAAMYLRMNGILPPSAQPKK